MNKLGKYIFLLLPLTLGSCSLFPSNPDTPVTPGEDIKTFEFVTDDYMTIDDSNPDSKFYLLTLDPGDKYQIKTTVDDKLGDAYRIEYTISEKDKTYPFTLGLDGQIVVNDKVTTEDDRVGSIYANLYKTGKSTRITRKYCIFSIGVNKTADISLTNDGLTYDEATRTYSDSVQSGTTYAIKTRVTATTSYSVVYSFVNDSDKEFASISEVGVVTTNKVTEDKTINIQVATTQKDAPSKIIDKCYLALTLLKDDTPVVNEFRVFSNIDGKEIFDGDALTIVKEDVVTFTITIQGYELTEKMSLSEEGILELDNVNNKVTAIKAGTVTILFKYGEFRLSLDVTVLDKVLESLYNENGADGLIIINGVIHYLDEFYAIYTLGRRGKVDTAKFDIQIDNLSETHKRVHIEYYEGNAVAKLHYDVRFFVTEEYEGVTTSYYMDTFYKNSYYGEAHVLPNKGDIKLLCIPVWFTDSTTFFKESHKTQILEDLDYTLNSSRGEDEFYSLKDYYNIESHDDVNISVTISDFYESGTSYTNYTDMSSSTKANNHKTLATNAINWYFNNTIGDPLSNYDLDSDGLVDGILLFYGANYYGTKDETNRSIAFESENYGDSKYNYNTMCFCPIGSLYGRNKTSDPAIQLGTDDLSTYFRVLFAVNSRTVIHEVGHMFGNIDLYETQLASERYSPAGSNSMQDNNASAHDPYHLNRIGWSKPDIYASSNYNLGDKITVKIDDMQSSGQNIILKKDNSNTNSLYDEYLILELYAPTGVNKYDATHSYKALANTQGIRLWHINSTLEDMSNIVGGVVPKTTEINEDGLYRLAYSNNDVDSEFDVVHFIRNNPDEEYNTNSAFTNGDYLFKEGESFDMATYASQFVNGAKLDNEEKLGWAFTVDTIYSDSTGKVSAIITLTRTDNTRTEFKEEVKLNAQLSTQPTETTEYGNVLVNTKDTFSLIYGYVTPPKVYNQNYPITQTGGMCLFPDQSGYGNGGYLELTILEQEGKEVLINSVTLVKSQLTNVTPTAIVGGDIISGKVSETEDTLPDGYNGIAYTYTVNAKSIKIMNSVTDNVSSHWSVLPLFSLIVEYTVR